MITSSFIPGLIFFIIPSAIFAIFAVQYGYKRQITIFGIFGIILGYWVVISPFAFLIDWVSSDELAVRYSLATLMSVVVSFFYFKFILKYIVESKNSLPDEIQNNISDGIKVIVTDEVREEPFGKKEIVQVPQGVTVSVKRSILIERQVSISSKASFETSFDAGFRELLMTTIRSNVENFYGETTKETEMVEYEINLDGNVRG
jgi:hypothetical protein